MIGFYDSGIGGLSILEEVLEIIPELNFQYLADTKFLPLGEKTTDEIQSRVKVACTFLFDQGCDLVVLACNTASVTSIRHIQQVWLPQNFPDKQVLSVTKPLTELLEQRYSFFRTEPGLLMSTPTTHNSGFYQYEFLRLGFPKLTSAPFPGLANMIESGKSEAIVENLIRNLKPVLTSGIEFKYVVLACTHYKKATSEIQKILPSANIIEPSQFTALKLQEYLIRHKRYNSNKGENTYWFSGYKPMLIEYDWKLVEKLS